MVSAYLRADHADFHRRLTRLEESLQATPGAGPVPEALLSEFRRIARDIQAHEKATEGVLYPYLKVRMDGRSRLRKSKLARAELLESIERLRGRESLMSELLGEQSLPLAQWLARFRVYREHLVAHWKTEERGLLRACLLDLSERENRDLAHRFIETKFCWLADA